MTNDPLHFLLYKSTAETDLDAGDDLDILAEAVANNMPNGITGFLVRMDNSFIQILEGAKDVIEETYERILKDKRHSDCQLMWQGTTDTRRFPKWAMSYASLSTTKELDELETLLANKIEDEAAFERCITIFKKELSFLEREGRIAF